MLSLSRPVPPGFAARRGRLRKRINQVYIKYARDVAASGIAVLEGEAVTRCD